MIGKLENHLLTSPYLSPLGHFVQFLVGNELTQVYAYSSYSSCFLFRGTDGQMKKMAVGKECLLPSRRESFFFLSMAAARRNSLSV